ncbi:hypothetical protein ACH5RR_023835 [Cinchona calisaya]|uniref:alpha,alpha-trehalase n=1 Tax=Cinchona calisaya TaxID=153742 RepID=A0ABD2ZGT9_9GENT
MVFMRGYLEGTDEDLVYAEPEEFLPKVENFVMRAWALEVPSLWKNLSGKVSERILERPDLQKPVIIPGSRFQEVYYWDSYWV